MYATETSTPAGSPVTSLTFTSPNMFYVGADVLKGITASDSLIIKVDGTEWQEGTTPGTDTWQEDTGSGTAVERTTILFNNNIAGSTIEVNVKQFVYFSRATTTSQWEPISSTTLNKQNWLTDANDLYKREHGRYPLNFAWFYTTPRLHLVDPAPSNIIDMFIITRGYYQGLQRWLENKTDTRPTPPTPLDLRTTYASLLENRMISDSVILQSGEIKILFGRRAIPELQAKFKVIRPSINNLTDNEVKVKIVEAMRTYFDLNYWNFGETFFFTEMSSAIHNELGPEIKSIVLVPSYNTNPVSYTHLTLPTITE